VSLLWHSLDTKVPVFGFDLVLLSCRPCDFQGASRYSMCFLKAKSNRCTSPSSYKMIILLSINLPACPAEEALATTRVEKKSKLLFFIAAQWSQR